MDDAERLLRALIALLPKDRDEVGRAMHDSWSATKRAQGYHGPAERCSLERAAPCLVGATGSQTPCYRMLSATQPDMEEEVPENATARWRRCQKYHADLIPWEALPPWQQEINRTAHDAILGPVVTLLASPEYAPYRNTRGAPDSEEDTGKNAKWPYRNPMFKGDDSLEAMQRRWGGERQR